MMEALSSSETSVLTRTTRHYIQEDAILHTLYLNHAFNQHCVMKIYGQSGS
jgi:hypothetical protein